MLTSPHGVNILEGHFAPHFYYFPLTRLLTMTQLNPRPIYSQTANPNATNSELDAKVVVKDGRGFKRLTNDEWEMIFSLVDVNLDVIPKKYKNISKKLRQYQKEDEVVNRLCDTDKSDYSSIPSRF